MGFYGTRKTDKLSRVVLPHDAMNKIQLGQEEAVDVYVVDDCIVIKKTCDRCVLCDSIQNLAVVKGHHVCQSCIDEIKQT